MIRRTAPDDIPLLPGIEHRADLVYTAYPEFHDLQSQPSVMPATDTALPQGAVVLVAEDETGIVGFIYGHPMDDCLFIGQLSVVPEAQRRGIGSQLLCTFCVASRDTNMRGVTLMTYGHLPFNAPFYVGQGFCPISADEMGPSLAREFAIDTAKWGRYGLRVAMGLWF